MFADAFIKEQPWLEPYHCSVCFQLSQNIFKQNCPCQKYVCLKCAKQQSNKCKYCTQSATVQLIDILPIKFFCPSRSAKCSGQIKSVRELLQHGRNCAYINEELKKEMVQIADYECVNGHQLTMRNTYIECQICKVSRHCKSFCNTCSEDKDYHKKASYCIECRPIRCSKYVCPSGHPLEMRQERRWATCDVCELSVSKFFKTSYTDSACDFDICMNCHKKLPESLDPQTSTEAISE